MLTPAQKNLINLYEKYWILIHRRFKWKIKTKDSPAIGRYKADESCNTSDVLELSRRRKRKASQNEDIMDCVTSKEFMLNTDTPKGNLKMIVRHFCRYTFKPIVQRYSFVYDFQLTFRKISSYGR